MLNAPNNQQSADDWPANMRRQVASRYLKVEHGIDFAPATMARYFCQRSDGPPAYIAGGRFPLYPRTELDAWAAKRLGKLRRSTSDNPT